jgi:hypothetical protein
MEDTYHEEPNPIDNYRFNVVTCFRDNASNKVIHRSQPNFILPLTIPKDKLIDKPSTEQDVSS